MKRFIFLLCLVAGISSVGIGQGILVRGQVTDKQTGQPVVAANILLPDGTGTYSGAEGNFEIRVPAFPVVLNVSHISYGKTVVKLDRDPGGLLIVELEELVSEIGEVQVSARKLRILTEKDDFTLQDFAFDSDYLWLIGYLNNQANQGRLWLANWFGDTISSVKVQNPERLFNDVFGSVHLVMKDSVHQLLAETGRILFSYSFERNDFFQTMAPIRAGFAGNLVYQTFLPEKQGLHTYFYSGIDQKPYFLSLTRDTCEENSQLFDHLYGPGMVLMEALYSYDYKVRLEALHAIGRNKISSPGVVNRRVNVPVFSLNDTLFLVNLYKDSLLTFGPRGHLVRTVPINYHKDTFLFETHYRKLQYLPDPVNHMLYLLQRKTTAWILTEFNPVTGKAGAQVPLPDFPGMSGITVNGKAVYFLYPEKKYPYYVRLFRYQL